MANITIKELLAADKVSELVDKINFNFDQLLLNGGGPLGLKGGPGIQGPIGARGTIWFTANDLWTTPDSPSWSGTPVKANNPLVVGYPQFKGDPNRFRPAAPVGVVAPAPYVFPEHTYTFNIPIKPVRGGDLFLQEADDTFNLQSSLDGDIWEYSASTLKWIFTGVNIKGNTGTSGANAFSEWIRITSGVDDLIYPKHVTGQNTTRLLMGQYSNVFKMDNSSAVLTINTDTTHIAFNHPAIHNELVTPGDEELGAAITMTSGGDLLILGASAGAINGKQIIVQSVDTNIIIQSGGLNFLTYTQNPTSSIHIFDGGAINVNHPNDTLSYTISSVPTGASTTHYIEQRLKPTEGRATISTGATGYVGFLANFLNSPHLLLQSEAINIFKNVGIGYMPYPNQPGSKLSIAGNLAVGFAYSLLTAPTNGAIFEGKVGIGTPTFPSGAAHNLQVNGAIILGSSLGFINDNIYWDQINSDWRNAYAGAGYMLRQDPTSLQSYDALYLYVWPHNATPNTNNPNNAYLAIDQRAGNGLGKLGVNAPAWILDSRITLNDTDGTGLHFIRSGSVVPGTYNFSGSLASGARLWHSVLAHTTSGTADVDGRFNIYQYQTSDLVIGNKTLAYPTNATHHRIVIKKESGFIGINTLRPKHTFTIKGRDYISEPDLDSPSPIGGFQFDPDEVTMGTFEDVSIFGLNVASHAVGGGLNTSTNIQGASYIGFNAWFANPHPAIGSPGIVYGAHENNWTNGSAGAIFFADRNGNFHWANLEVASLGDGA